MGKSLKIGISNPSKLLNNPVASCCLINFEFLLLHTEHFDKDNILSFLVLTTFGFLLSVYFYISNNETTLFLYIV